MRLVHTVLLPGIVIFVSKMTLLQAHSLRGDVAGHLPSSGLHDIDAEAVDDDESRMSRNEVMKAVFKRLTQAKLNGDNHRSVVAAVKELLQKRTPRDEIVEKVNLWMHPNYHFRAGDFSKKTKRKFFGNLWRS